MKKVVILGFHGALASSITGIFDFLAMAGVSWNRIRQQHIQKLFSVQLASCDAQPILCSHQLSLGCHISFAQIEYADLIIIPTIAAPIEHVLQANPMLINCLKAHHRANTLIAANCTGNFFLAEAGLLTGKVATTHWGYAALFQQRYPEVNLQTEQWITHDQGIYCSGGGMAWFDLCFYLIEYFYGADIALQAEKSYVINTRRDRDVTRHLNRLDPPHQDALILQVQSYIAENLSQPLTLAELASRFNVSTRTLIRRFQSAMQLTPAAYVQKMRLQAAQKRLQETDQHIEQIMQHIGYQDASAFRRVFRQNTGLSPLAYRRRFSQCG